MTLDPFYFFCSLLLFCCSLFLKKFQQQFYNPSILFAKANFFSSTQKKIKVENILLYLSALLLFLGLMYPYRSITISKTTTKEGISIYLLLDRSSSMNETIDGKKTKLETLEEVTKGFIKKRVNDEISLIAFARDAEILVPPTFDHQEVLEQVGALRGVTSDAEDGTAIGYALYKTIQLILTTNVKKQQSIIVLVTDGADEPNPLDRDNKWKTISLEDVGALAKEEKIPLYIINVDPQIQKEPFRFLRNFFRRVAQGTGGGFFVAEDSSSLSKVYRTIDELHKIPLEDRETIKSPLYPYFVLPALLLLGCGILLETLWIRKIP